MCGIFLFYLDLELFAKIKKDLVSTHWFFTLFNNSRSKQKKFPHTLLSTLLSGKRVQSQNLNFSDKKPGFLEIIEVCFNLGIKFCIT